MSGFPPTRSERYCAEWRESPDPINSSDWWASAPPVRSLRISLSIVISDAHSPPCAVCPSERRGEERRVGLVKDHIRIHSAGYTYWWYDEYTKTGWATSKTFVMYWWSGDTNVWLMFMSPSHSERTDDPKEWVPSPPLHTLLKSWTPQFQVLGLNWHRFKTELELLVMRIHGQTGLDRHQSLFL